jgi:hypothetical protein
LSHSVRALRPLEAELEAANRVLSRRRPQIKKSYEIEVVGDPSI